VTDAFDSLDGRLIMQIAHNTRGRSLLNADRATIKLSETSRRRPTSWFGL
jgi:hypothetical protein